MSVLETPWTRPAPASWARTYLGHLVEARSGGTPTKDEPSFWNGDIPWVSPKDMKVFRIADAEDHVTAAALQRTVLRMVPTGSVLMVTRGMILDHTVPVALTTAPVTINQDMKALLPRSGIEGAFLTWLLSGLNHALLARVEEAAHGAKALRTEQWRKLPLAVPPEPVQQQIARFLDQRTASIDALIEKKERLVALLAEKRQALLTEAVTEGLGRGSTTKGAGTQWGKTVPSTWKLLPLRRVVREFIDYRGRTPIKVAEGVPLITAGAVRNGKIDHARAPEFTTPKEYQEILRRGRPERGDVVFTTEAPLGEVALVEDTNVAFAQRIILFKVDVRLVNSSFLLFFLMSEAGRAEVLSRASGSTAEGIRADRLRSSLVLLPPREEQDRIVRHVTEHLKTNGPAERALDTQLGSLREYRQALITAAVTGQLDLSREPAAR